VRRRVIDASIAIKWYVKESGEEHAFALLQDVENQFWAPDFLVAELGNILWKKHRRAELSRERLREVAAVLSDPGRLSITLIRTQRLITSAVEIAADFDRSLYDALYLAAALVIDADFITADERLANAMSRSPLWQDRITVISA
jgi:predicted nucleic acid-binding protein